MKDAVQLQGFHIISLNNNIVSEDGILFPSVADWRPL